MKVILFIEDDAFIKKTLIYIQLLDGNLLAPLLLSEVINLRPIAINIGMLIVGGLGGVLWGVLAISLATLINEVIKS